VTYLYGRVLASVTVSHQELNPRDKMTLAPPDRKSTHTLSTTVRKDENRVLGGDTHEQQSHTQDRAFDNSLLRRHVDVADAVVFK